MFGKIAVIGLVLTCVVGCKAQSSSPSSAASPQYRGAQWLGWGEVTRDIFVFAFIDGYKQGASDACRAGDKLFDFKNGIVPEHSKDEIPLPSGTCRAHSDQYSHCQVGAPEGHVCSAYTGVITAFYTKHPEYQNIPFEYLMQYLTDKEHKSADDLYSMAKAGMMRTSW